MDSFDRLLSVAERLLGPEGCPWDHTQTFESLQPYVLEEAHEVIEAVDRGEDLQIIEELGDLLYTVIFYAKIAEKSQRFSMKEILETVTEKLIRRHPHVFGDVKTDQVEEIIKNWETIKKQEKKGKPSQDLLEAMPPTLPTLVKAQKLIRKLGRGGALPEGGEEECTEEKIGHNLFHWVLSAEKSGIDAESALRRTLQSFNEK